MSKEVDQLIEASRRVYPKEWALVDKIAPIIDPDAFTGPWYDSTIPTAEPMPMSMRQKYMKAMAQRKAWEILGELGLADKVTDWEAIFSDLVRNIIGARR